MKMVMTVILWFLFMRLTAPELHVAYIAEYPPSQKGFQHYADDLGYHESRNNPFIVNKIGCFAEHQWKESTLHCLGYTEITLRRFKKDPVGVFPRSTQLEALKALTDTNKVHLEPFECYVGTVIDDITITWSGLLAASHLAGTQNVEKYLLTNGRYIIIDDIGIVDILSIKKKHKKNAKDMNGTSIKDYLSQFAGYNI